MPFDGKRMIYGGFETLVELERLIGAPRIAPGRIVIVPSQV